MSEQVPGQEPPAPETDVDLEYDLAHDANSDCLDAPYEQPPADMIVVATETPTYSGGDYSYDLAHDIPRG
jgi:hypothetical protein